MDLRLSEDQQSLKESARRFLAAEFPSGLVRQVERNPLGYSPEIWQKMAELAWMAAPFEGAYGGLDGSLLDVAMVTEELAQAAALTPYVPTIVAGLVIQRSGNEAQKERFLRPICESGLAMTVALVEPSGSYDPAGVQLKAKKRGSKYVLNGTKLFVESANAAKELICVARTGRDAGAGEGITLFIVPTDAPGVARQSLKVIGGDQQSEVTFTDVEVSADRVLGAVGEGWSTVSWMLNVVRSLASMEQVGFAQRALDMTVDYAGYREAFGVPIGSFQAVHQRCADMAIALEGARWATYESLWRLDKGLDVTYLASAAKAIADRAGRDVTMSAHLLHAGIGYMEEFDLQFYSRRAKGWELKWGTPDQMYLKVADSIGL